MWRDHGQMTLPKPAMIKIAQAHGIQPRKQGGEGGTGMKPTVQLVSQIVEKQKVRPRKHHISSRIEYAVKSLAHLKMLTHHAGKDTKNPILMK
jgi:hypothetical protein